jgi:predicted DNA-binding transcriptional regulator AlpA
MRKGSKAARVRRAATVDSAPVILDLIDIDEVRSLVGGSKPLSKATVYREISRGNLPKGVLVAPNSARWLRSEIEAVLQKAFAHRSVA